MRAVESPKKKLAKEELGLKKKTMHVTTQLPMGARHALRHVPKRLPKGAEMRKPSWKLLTMMLKKHLHQKYLEG